MATTSGNVTYTYAQLMGIWINAGGNKQQAPLAAAIAMAESGGRVNATDYDSDGSVDRGLWQINSSHGAQSSYDVSTNVHAAISISCNGQCTNSCTPPFTGWGNWTTYCSGAYRQYLSPGTTPDTNVPVNGTAAVANQPTSGSGTTATETAASGLECLIPANLASCLTGDLGKALESVIGGILNPIVTAIAGGVGVLGGGIMMLMGAWIVFTNTDTGQAVKQKTNRVAGMATSAVGMATGQPELIAAGGGISSGGIAGGVQRAGTQRTQTIRGREVEQRQGRLISQRGQARASEAQIRLQEQQARTEQERIRQEALNYRHRTPRAR